MDPMAVPTIPRPPRRAARAGDLLVAAPSLVDPNFRRAVIFLLQHDQEGSAGVVINRRFKGSLAGIDLPEWVLSEAIAHDGGPVADDSLLALASTATAPSEVHRAVGGELCVVDLDALKQVPAFHPVQLFVGYAGWSQGQLEAELVRDDWLVVPADPFDVLATDPERVWTRVMRRQPDMTRLWATMPQAVAAN